MNSLLSSVDATPFVPSFEQEETVEEQEDEFSGDELERQNVAELLGHEGGEGYYEAYYARGLWSPPEVLPANFDQNTNTICRVFERCVVLMRERMQMYTDFATTVTTAFPDCELGGSAVHGGSTFSSDIDMRWSGEDFGAFIQRLCAFSDEHNMAAVPVGKNLCKLIRDDITVDVLIVPGMARLLERTDDTAYSATAKKVVRRLREFQTDENRREIKYNQQKSVMFARCYDRVMGHSVWRSIVVFLKLLDPKLPTCFVVMMVALAAKSIRKVEMAQAWRIALEIIAQFNWRFLRGVQSEDHIAYSFVEEIWRPFYKDYIEHLKIEGAFANPIGELFNEEQVAAIANSEFLLSKLTGEWYPLAEVPVSLGAPRSFSQSVPRVMADFIVLVGFEWEPMRELYIRGASGSLEHFQALAQAYWNTETMYAEIYGYMSGEVSLAEQVCDVLEAMV